MSGHEDRRPTRIDATEPTLQVLEAARALVATPQQWTRRAWARDRYRHRRSALAASACRYCVAGAIMRAALHVNRAQIETAPVTPRPARLVSSEAAMALVIAGAMHHPELMEPFLAGVGTLRWLEAEPAAAVWAVAAEVAVRSRDPQPDGWSAISLPDQLTRFNDSTDHQHVLEALDRAINAARAAHAAGVELGPGGAALMRLELRDDRLVVVLSVRNLRVLLVKLDDARSARTVISGRVPDRYRQLVMTAVDQPDRPPRALVRCRRGSVVVCFNRPALVELLAQQGPLDELERPLEAADHDGLHTLRIESDAIHYARRPPPGPMSMRTEHDLSLLRDRSHS